VRKIVKIGMPRIPLQTFVQVHVDRRNTVYAAIKKRDDAVTTKHKEGVRQQILEGESE
jgi:hypothetical protein